MVPLAWSGLNSLQYWGCVSESSDRGKAFWSKHEKVCILWISISCLNFLRQPVVYLEHLKTMSHDCIALQVFSRPFPQYFLNVRFTPVALLSKIWISRLSRKGGSWSTATRPGPPWSSATPRGSGGSSWSLRLRPLRSNVS